MKPIKLAAAFALLFAVGCAAGPSAPPDYLPTNVNINNADLARDLTRLPVTEKFEPSGQLTVTVPVRLNTDFGQDIDYRFTFLDANNQPVDTNPAWMHQRLEANTVSYITGTSPVLTAKDFRVDIRPAE